MATVEEGTFSILANKVMFVNKLSLLYMATSDDEKPTPGYMYQEICKSGSHCQDLLDVLVDRLEEKSSHVKVKVLRIMKYVVEKGHPDFRHSLRRKANGIQAATKHSGPPDPLHGMAPYILVRKEAQVLIQLLFDTTETETITDSTVPQSKPMGSISSVGIGSVDQRGNLQGFGNVPAKQKTLGDSIMSNIRDAAEKVFDLQSPIGDLDQAGRQELQPHFGAYQPVQVVPKADYMELEKSSHRKAFVRNKERKKGRALGGWEDENIELGAGSNAGRPRRTEAIQEDLLQRKEEENFEHPHKAPLAEAASAEASAVAEWLNTNTSHLPNRSDIDAFVSKCSCMNCDLIVKLLDERLHDEKDITLMKCMLVLESMLSRDLVSADLMASTCCEHLLHLFNRPHDPVQSKARKLLRILEKLCTNQEFFSSLPKPTRDSDSHGRDSDSHLSKTDSQSSASHSSTTESQNGQNKEKFGSQQTHNVEQRTISVLETLDTRLGCIDDSPDETFSKLQTPFAGS